jgi:hypothetical protein
VVALHIGMHLHIDMQFANILAMCGNRGEKGNHVGLPLPTRIHITSQNDKKSTQPLTNANLFSIFLRKCDAISSLRRNVLRDT